MVTKMLKILTILRILKMMMAMMMMMMMTVMMMVMMMMMIMEEFGYLKDEGKKTFVANQLSSPKSKRERKEMMKGVRWYRKSGGKNLLLKREEE